MRVQIKIEWPGGESWIGNQLISNDYKAPRKIGSGLMVRRSRNPFTVLWSDYLHSMVDDALNSSSDDLIWKYRCVDKVPALKNRKLTRKRNYFPSSGVSP